jgi:UDP-GlcNAc:undecaprenyl-phosphate GlcNAc-1-phosphate transferase
MLRLDACIAAIQGLPLTSPEPVPTPLPVFQPIVVFLLAMAGALLLTPLVIRLAHRFGALDWPGRRKVHERPVPRLGGVAIIAGFALAAPVGLAFSERLRTLFFENLPFSISVAIGALLVFLLGLYDDLRGASVLVKFAVQIAAACLVVFVGKAQVVLLTNPFGEGIEIGWLGVPITLLWIVGVTNAFNLIDGLDGLAGGLAFISTATVFVIALMSGSRQLVVFASAALAGALLGFLRYNFHPARIFLGDSGSMFLGFMLAVLSVAGVSKRTTALAVLIPILILGIPVFDTLYAMVRRFVRALFLDRERSVSALGAMFRADREHIHHTLLEMGYTHWRAVVLLYGMSVLLGALALLAVVLKNDRVSFGLILAGIAGFVLVKQFGKYLPLWKKNGEGE